MINTTTTTVKGSMSPSSAAHPQSQALKTYFKTPDGRYNLHSDKSHPSSLLPFYLAKSITQITLAHLKDKAAQPPSSSSGSSSGVRHVAARLLGSGNAIRGNGGTSKVNSGTSRTGSLGGLNGYSSLISSNFDGKGTYLVFNVGDTLYVSDLNSQDKDPIKALHFSNSNPVCHAFDCEAKDGHDLLIGLNCGDVYSVSLRQQLQDVGKKLVGAQHYNKEGSTNNSRCTSITWIPGREGAFVVAHADGNLYEYEKSKDGTGDASFPVIKDLAQFSVAHAKSSKSNPIARWHICDGSINGIAFSSDGKYLATVGRDGYSRVFDYSNEQLICGGRSYYGALLCCAWSGDGKYILTGGEDDLVQVWSMEDRKIVAWGEGHNSWVSGVAFDSYWSPPTSEDIGENVMYRFGSVGQDTQLLLWDLSMEEIVVPLRWCLPGGSPSFSTGSQSSHWDSVVPVGTLQPAPSMRDVPKLSPLVAHRVHSEPLSGLIFTQESVITACREGHVKIWTRPGQSDQSNNSEALQSSGLKKTFLSGKVGSSSSYK
ncbi:putative catabolite repression protein creC [Camellia lanceoleosa]|uniref:Catabolite repression protein creC n=1 Tax=Camellia lanceoleosa TaxID=1840588 RepID=A0ACC0F6T0_9ERIC|nr:putative catabolite repression protein creC [Camellia lanceoleosa]